MTTKCTTKKNDTLVRQGHDRVFQRMLFFSRVANSTSVCPKMCKTIGRTLGGGLPSGTDHPSSPANHCVGTATAGSRLCSMRGAEVGGVSQRPARHDMGHCGAPHAPETSLCSCGVPAGGHTLPP